MKLVAGHPDRMGYFYRFPHVCPAGYCAIAQYLRTRKRTGERRLFVHRMRARKTLDTPKGLGVR